MKKSILSLIGATCFVPLQTLSAASLEMVSPADYKTYQNSHNDTVSMSVIESVGANWKQYSNYLGKAEQWIWLSNDNTQLYWYSPENGSQLLLNSGDRVGTQYEVDIDGCTDRATVAAKNRSINLTSGSYDDVTRLDFSGYCFDAGLKSAWFVSQLGLIKWTEDSLLGEVEFELAHAKVNGMSIPNHQGIELSAQFPAETIMLNEQGSVEAAVTLINHSDAPMTLDFTSGQTFEIYLYNEKDTLVSLWSTGKMFTQALHSLEIQPGEVQRFGGELELVDLDGEPLDIGSYRMKIEVKGSFAPETTSHNPIPLSAESVLHLDSIMTHQ